MKQHLEEVNMTYFQHLRFAWGIAVVLLIHGVCPKLFANYAYNKFMNR